MFVSMVRSKKSKQKKKISHPLQLSLCDSALNSVFGTLKMSLNDKRHVGWRLLH